MDFDTFQFHFNSTPLIHFARTNKSKKVRKLVILTNGMSVIKPLNLKN